MTQGDSSNRSAPVGVNHIVLNVHDIEESHEFWTEVIGLQQVGTLHPRDDMGDLPVMRFYSGNRDGQLNHHDLALVENKDLPPRPKDGDPHSAPQAINHVAFAM
ncbi:MAG: VOC family protein, partial [Rhodospirillales bacterium]|nr:VOC family protein [Rhodospirillales bacterium]